MTRSDMRQPELAAELRSMPSFVSLVWTLRITAIAMALWLFAAVSGAGAFVLVGMACPVISFVLLAGTVVAVVASQALPEMPEDAFANRISLVIGIIGSAARCAVIGLPSRATHEAASRPQRSAVESDRRASATRRG